MHGTKALARGLPGWVVALVLGIAVIGLMFWTWGRLGPSEPDGGSPEADIVVRYEGRNWIPVDPALAARFPDDHMVMVGLDGRRTLWANRAGGLAGGGGGAGVRAPEGLETGAFHRIYVRLEDGRYLPMMWQSAAPGSH